MKVIPKIMDYARACLKQLLHRQKVSHTGWFMGCREAFLQSLFACVLSYNSLIGSFMFSEYMFYTSGENQKFDKPIICWRGQMIPTTPAEAFLTALKHYDVNMLARRTNW